MNRLKKLFSSQDSKTVIEYMLIAGLVVIVTMTGIRILSTSKNQSLFSVDSLR
ncbi:MAG: hypothetical protein LBH38_02575 [Holosporales bacterium]|jgi:Flp pilus assembly pilin Flp|nr:hypothetical protein [Holosporales bacterium]